MNYFSHLNVEINERLWEMRLVEMKNPGRAKQTENE
jgi:hypothetical protein